MESFVFDVSKRLFGSTPPFTMPQLRRVTAVAAKSNATAWQEKCCAKSLINDGEP
jgi:hypothetical protein